MLLVGLASWFWKHDCETQMVIMPTAFKFDGCLVRKH